MRALSPRYNQNSVCEIMDELVNTVKDSVREGYIWRGCELYLHCSNIKVVNVDKESDLICQALPDFHIKRCIYCILCYSIFMFNCYDYGNVLNSDMRSVARFCVTTYKQRHKNWRDRVIVAARGIIFSLLHRCNYFRSFLLGGVTVQQCIILRWMYSILLDTKKLIISPYKFLTIYPATAGERVNNNE